LDLQGDHLSRAGNSTVAYAEKFRGAMIGSSQSFAAENDVSFYNTGNLIM
jgi:hypothetical protein